MFGVEMVADCTFEIVEEFVKRLNLLETSWVSNTTRIEAIHLFGALSFGSIAPGLFNTGESLVGNRNTFHFLFAKGVGKGGGGNSGSFGGRNGTGKFGSRSEGSVGIVQDSCGKIGGLLGGEPRFLEASQEITFGNDFLRFEEGAGLKGIEIAGNGHDQRRAGGFEGER